MEQTQRGGTRPSAVFLALVAGAVVAVLLAWRGPIPPPIAVFLLVTSGWIVSLCLHEYAHAVLAYRGGDVSVAAKGYLTLDPRRYSHPLLSVGLPVLFVLLGGIGLPGGAVWIDSARIRGRLAESLVSAAGPAVNALVALVLVGAYNVGGGTFAEDRTLWFGVAFLALLQITATLLNLLPVPGLDGFGILAPWLPAGARGAGRRYAQMGLILVFGLLWIPEANAAFFDAVYSLASLAGVNAVHVELGRRLFQFWEARG